MERATVMKTFHGNLTPKSPPPTLRDRDASFSSYLQPHHTIGSDLSRSGLDDSITELSIFDAHKYFNEVANNDNNIHKVTSTTTTITSNNSRVSPLVTNNSSNKEIMEGEIITDTTTRYSSASSSSVDGYGNMMRNYRARSFHAATPTASSEASWNSQTGLLSHPKGAIPVSMMNTTNPSSNPADPNKKVRTSFSKPIWFLRKKCPCSGKKSVQVKEPKITQIPPPQIPKTQKDHHSLNLKRQQDHDHTLKNNNIIPITPNNWVVATTKSQRFQNSQSQSQSHQVVTSSNGFTFPVLNPHSSNTNTNIKLHVPDGVVLEKDLDPARDSLEVFQPPTNNDTMQLATVSPNTSRVNNNNVMIDEDAESDASSDLFEIESFSTATAATQSSYPAAMYSRRDSMEDGSSNNGFFFRRRSMDERSTAATECYEPSEASIEWSVTTAAAEEESIGVGAVQSNGDDGEKWKKKGYLVSCRSEKAVSVGPQPVMRALEGQRGATCSSRHVSLSSGFKTEGVVNVNKPPLARSNNNHPRLSLAFAT